MSARSPQPSTAVAGVTIIQHGTHNPASAGFDHSRFNFPLSKSPVTTGTRTFNGDWRHSSRKLRETMSEIGQVMLK
ncbi:hypothetical protein EMIT0P100_180023 [Pseudomonas sp. IT-P100]